MKMHQEELKIATPGRSLIEVSSEVERVVAEARIEVGLCVGG